MGVEVTLDILGPVFPVPLDTSNRNRFGENKEQLLYVINCLSNLL